MMTKSTSLLFVCLMYVSTMTFSQATTQISTTKAMYQMPVSTIEIKSILSNAYPSQFTLDSDNSTYGGANFETGMEYPSSLAGYAGSGEWKLSQNDAQKGSSVLGTFIYTDVDANSCKVEYNHTLSNVMVTTTVVSATDSSFTCTNTLLVKGSHAKLNMAFTGQPNGDLTETPNPAYPTTLANGSGNADIQVTIENTSGTNTVTLGTPAISISQSSTMFTAISATADCDGQALMPSGSCLFTLTFDPSSPNVGTSSWRFGVLDNNIVPKIIYTSSTNTIIVS